MLGQIKMLRAQRVRHIVHALRFNQDRAEHRLLRLKTVGQSQTVPGERLIVSHSDTPLFSKKVCTAYSVTVTVILATTPGCSLISTG